MPRSLAIQELATLLGVLSHPDRVRIIEELRTEEHDVSFLAAQLEVAQARVSQHLSVLRAHRLVRTRREGRHVFYQLANARIADWLVDGLDFLEASIREGDAIKESVAEARSRWGS
jgi:DNA-binding transcriptional ArsR family regulator